MFMPSKQHAKVGLTTGIYWQSEINVIKSMTNEKYPPCRIAEVLNREYVQVLRKPNAMRKRGLI